MICAMTTASSVRADQTEPIFTRAETLTKWQTEGEGEREEQKERDKEGEGHKREGERERERKRQRKRRKRERERERPEAGQLGVASTEERPVPSSSAWKHRVSTGASSQPSLSAYFVTRLALVQILAKLAARVYQSQPQEKGREREAEEAKRQTEEREGDRERESDRTTDPSERIKGTKC